MQRLLSPDEAAASIFMDAIYAAVENASLLPEIFRRAFGGLAPEKEVDPSSFVTNSDLENCVRALRLSSGKELLDLGCGTGGPGLWIARETGSNLTGVDYSSTGIEIAQKRAALFLPSRHSRYVRASMRATGLSSGAFDGVVSIDALQMVADKQDAFREVRRLLRSHGWFVFTTWDAKLPGLRRFPPTQDEYQKCMRDAGFEIESYEETENWEVLQRAVYAEWLSKKGELVREIGQQVFDMLADEASWAASRMEDGTDVLSKKRRVFVVCQAR